MQNTQSETKAYVPVKLRVIEQVATRVFLF